MAQGAPPGHNRTPEKSTLMTVDAGVR
jgi:hypothetical protein